jgi:hypothetical protein
MKIKLNDILYSLAVAYAQIVLIVCLSLLNQKATRRWIPVKDLVLPNQVMIGVP